MVHFDHLALIISSEENLSFYQKLGFVETKRINREYDKVVFMESGNVILEIFVDSKHPDRLTKPEALGIRHIGLVVDDLEKVQVDIGNIGRDWFGRRYAFAIDPDGQPIELKEVGDKCDAEAKID